MKYQEYFSDRVAPQLNNILKERDYTNISQVQELLRGIKEVMYCETVAYFTHHSLQRDRFFIPEGYVFSETSFPTDVELPYCSPFIRKPLTSGKYLLRDRATLDTIEPPFDALRVNSLIATPVEDDFSYGILFAFNGRGIEKQFRISFNFVQCSIFRLITKVVDFPAEYGIKLIQEMGALKDEPLSQYFLSTLADIQGEDRLVDGINTYYQRNREIHFILLTPTRILSIVQKRRKSRCNTFHFRDIVSIHEKSYLRKGSQKADIQIEFIKGNLTWAGAKYTYDTHRFLRNIRTLFAINKDKV